MAKYISAVEAAEKAETALKIPLAALVDVFAGIPAADVAPVRHGRWKVIEGMIENAICSNCERHFQSYYEAYHYCPNCVAKMDGKGGDA